MSLTPTKPADAKAMNTAADGAAPASFNVVDSDGSWYVNKGVYPIIDAEGGARFEPGVPTRAIGTQWVENQVKAGSLEKVDAPADAKGKAAKTPDPSLDERPPEGDVTDTGGMKSAVAT